MPEIIKLHSNKSILPKKIILSASKSESNRVLIINALSGNPSYLENVSDARDTQTMQRLLSSTDEELDVLDAGTTMRFLTGYLGVAAKAKTVLTGSARMQERPIKILVDALKELGARINYLNNDGYPPLEIHPLTDQLTDEIQIPSNISSQYISALLMIAPVLPKGLKIKLLGEVFSLPYIKMTLSLMERFGVNHHWAEDAISILHQDYQSGSYVVESDWSGASYWYGVISLAREGAINLKGLRQSSNQGDQAIMDIMSQLGVDSTYDDGGVQLSKSASKDHVEIDFRSCPDLAQTVMVSAGAQGVDLTMTGLESLRIKETDRIAALQNELGKMNVQLIEVDKHHWQLKSGGFKLEAGTLFETYDDHRMAMAFAPLCMIEDIRIENPGVVAKSYPGFWKDLERVGVQIAS